MFFNLTKTGRAAGRTKSLRHKGDKSLSNAEEACTGETTVNTLVLLLVDNSSRNIKTNI